MKHSIIFVFFALLFTLCQEVQAAPTCRAKRGYSATYDQKKKKCVYKKLPRSKWTIKTERDSFTGKKYVYAYLPAEGTISGTFRRYKPQLYVRCSEDVLDIFVAFGPTMSCSGEVYSMRFDNYAIFDMYTVPADDCSTMFLDDSDFSNHDFLYSLGEAGKLRVRADVYGVGYQTVTFSLAGASQVYDRIVAQCPEPPPEDDDGEE